MIGIKDRTGKKTKKVFIVTKCYFLMDMFYINRDIFFFCSQNYVFLQCTWCYVYKLGLSVGFFDYHKKKDWGYELGRVLLLVPNIGF